MSMSDHIKQQVVQEFLPKRSRSPRKRQNWILLFYQNGRRSKHIENISHIQSRGSVAHCFKLLQQCEVQNSLENSLKQVTEVRIQFQSISFFFCWVHMFSLSFSFADNHYFTWLPSFDLLLL